MENTNYSVIGELLMIKITAVPIQKEKDYDALKKAVPAHLMDDKVIECLKKYIGTKCDTIKVEYPYYDSDYLSTYYEHYAQKFKKYEKTCCRLHLEAGEDYYGYITLRPSVEGTKIGKTYIAPELLLDKDAYLMLSNFDAHVAGQKLEIRCFPWKKQQTDISVCAHTATWTVIRYFGNKYKNYADTTIGDIVEKVENDWGRKTPSLGLDPVQISDLFKQYGLSPLIIGGEKTSDHTFMDEIVAYVESGLPMVGFLSPQDHAISIIGHGRINYESLDNPETVEHLLDKEANVIPHSRLISSLYVMDDRYFPYREVPMGLPNKHSDVKYGVNELYYAVVPLYNRMQLAYREVYERMVLWLKANVMKWEKVNVCRIYITSANSLRYRAVSSSTMPQVLKDVIQTLSLPKFVWCIDLAGIENYKKGLTTGRIIIDTTSATWEKEPWIMRHDMEKVQYKDYDEDPNYVYTKKIAIAPYKMYENNLKHI